MKHLYFMRHGISEMNQRGLFSGRSDTPLTKEGIDQCKKAAADLEGVVVDLIVSSPMKRTYDSARVIADEIGYPENKIILSDLFMERELGELEGTDYRKGLNLKKYEGVEQNENLLARAKIGLEYLNGLDADTIVLVSHSAIGRALKSVIDPKQKLHRVSSFKNAELVKLI